MRKAIPLLAIVMSSLLLVTAAQAEREKKRRPAATKSSPSTAPSPTYKWVDENGITHYGDTVPAEYSQREQTLLNDQGVVVGKRQAEMDPKEAAALAARQKEEARKKQHDMFLLSTYPSVKEIENVRDARLEQISGQVAATEAYIANLSNRVEGLKQRSMSFAPYSKNPNARRMPDDLAEEMVRALSELRTQNSALNAKRSELKNVSDGYDTDIARFKELRASAAARLNENATRKQ